MNLGNMFACLAIGVVVVSAHGTMNWPIGRPLPGDQQNGYTFARAASNRNLLIQPHPDINCSYLPKGPVFTQVMAPGLATVDYTISAWHNGGCVVFLSRDDQKTWTKIGEDPTCGISSFNPTGRGSIPVILPDGEYEAILRWHYLADNGGSPNEFFNSCADIKVSPNGGTNQHAKVEFLGRAPDAAFKNLAKSPSNYFDAFCPTVGSTMCSEDPGFINQCVGLEAGGGWVGGSSWFSYQCPFGTTCHTSNGVDACVGANGNPQPTVAVSTTAASTSTTTTTITPITTTSKVAITTTTTTTTAIPSPIPIPTTQTTSTTAISASTTAVVGGGGSNATVGQSCNTFGSSQCISGTMYVCIGQPHQWQVWYKGC
ncbi:UNVERIFIED_CONTAM: hypothetical protein HDU68_008108 [Siphonaria sp. JEL0065]|nr:hypothetical protein HDU68_008108 [Siphonaria sp. JEL0065]